MENLGDVFRKAREEKNLTIKDVSLQTNIGSKFIKALESNDFSVFPGDAYTIGFIRNYADFLKIDTDKVINLFYTHQISESETPIEELVAPTRPRLNPIPIILLIVLVAGIIIGLALFLKKPDKRESSIQTTQEVKKEKQSIQQQFSITELPLYSIKAIGDEIYVKLKEKIIKITIKKIEQKSIDIVLTSVGDNDFLQNLRKDFTIEVNKQLKYDFDKNKEYEFSIGVESLPSPAQVKLYLKKVEEPYENQRYYDYFTYQPPDQATLTQLQQHTQQSEKEQTNQNITTQQKDQQIQLPQQQEQHKDQSQKQQLAQIQNQIQSQQNPQSINIKNIKLDVSITNTMQRDSAIYVWVRRDNSNEIKTIRLVKNQNIKLDADNKLIIDTNNLYGLKVIVNGREINTKNISNDGGVGKIKFWIEKSSQGKTEIKWEISR